MLSADDHKQIEAALAEASRKTSAGIYCVIAREASHYREIPVVWAALAALVLPPIALLLGLRPLALASIFQGWAVAETHVVERDVLLSLFYYAAAQSLIFVVVMLLAEIPTLRRMLTPGPLKHRRVKQAAQTYFASIAIHHPREGEHLLIYASQADRRVEIVAGEAVHQALGAALWQRLADAVVVGMREGRATAGFVEAIALAANSLAQKFPPRADAQPMPPDALIEA